jgi:hypothetical protein
LAKPSAFLHLFQSQEQLQELGDHDVISDGGEDEAIVKEMTIAASHFRVKICRTCTFILRVESEVSPPHEAAQMFSLEPSWEYSLGFPLDWRQTCRHSHVCAKSTVLMFLTLD